MNLAHLLKDSMVRALDDDAASLGVRSAFGREVIAYVEPVPPGHFRVTDAGDAWTDLVMHGFTSAEGPTANEKRRVADLCNRYRLSWDQTTFELAAVATERMLPTAIQQVIAASTALSAWACWYPARHPSDPDSLAQAIVPVAELRGWKAERDVQIEGHMPGGWRLPLLLDHHGRKVGFDVFRESADAVAQRAWGWSSHTDQLPLVVGVKSRAAALRVLDVPRIAPVRVGRAGLTDDVLFEASRLTA